MSDPAGDRTQPLNRRRAEDVILQAIDKMREDVMSRLHEQDQGIAKIEITNNETAEKVAKMEKVLSGPLKFVKAAEGALSFGQLFERFMVWLTKCSLGVVLLWAVWKYVIVETIRNTPK